MDAIFGKFMFIRGTRDNNLYFLSHLDSFLKGEGDLVEPGEAVAITGTTGASSAEHLHLEVFVDVPADRRDVLDMDIIRGVRTNHPSRNTFRYYGALVDAERRFDLDAHRRDPFNHNRRITNNGQPNSRVIEGE